MNCITGETTLRNYTSVLPTSQGFQGHVLSSLRTEASELPENNRYVTLMHDEITIQQDLVFDFKTNELVGYVCQEELQQRKV